MLFQEEAEVSKSKYPPPLCQVSKVASALRAGGGDMKVFRVPGILIRSVLFIVASLEAAAKRGGVRRPVIP